MVNAMPEPNPPLPGPGGIDPSAPGEAGLDQRPGGLVAGPAPAFDAGPGVAAADPAGAPPLGKWLLIYTLLRIATLVVLTAVLSLLMPLILALLFAVVLALPLSWVVFGGVRRKVNQAMAVKSSSRRDERERLRAALDGRESE